MKTYNPVTSIKRGFTLISLFSLVAVCCKDNKEQPIATFEKILPEIDAIIAADASVTIIADGFEWSEGPVWIPENKMLLFSDIPRNSIYKWTEGKGKELYLKPAGYTGSASRGGETGSNGLLLNKDSKLVLCQHGDRRIALMNAPVNAPKADFTTLADNYQGKKFDSPNDAVYRGNGDLYFTDPPYGLEKLVEDSSKAAPYQGVYKLTPAGEVTLLTDSITRPNGIAFLPGENTILIANSDPKKPIWYAYDLDEKGLFINGRIFHDGTEASKNEQGSPDGLKVDKQGNVFATGPGGVWIFNKSGNLLGKIKVNGLTSNCALADDDNTLYITADMYVLKAKLR